MLQGQVASLGLEHRITDVWGLAISFALSHIHPFPHFYPFSFSWYIQLFTWIKVADVCVIRALMSYSRFLTISNHRKTK